MLMTILVLLIALWFLGYIDIPSIPIPDIFLFTINGRPISLWDTLIFLVIVALIGALPGPFRHVALALLVLWLLALFGIITLAGLPNMIVIALIVGLIAYMFSGRHT
jgi:hypothetical protein